MELLFVSLLTQSFSVVIRVLAHNRIFCVQFFLRVLQRIHRNPDHLVLKNVITIPPYKARILVGGLRPRNFVRVSHRCLGQASTDGTEG